MKDEWVECRLQVWADRGSLTKAGLGKHEVRISVQVRIFLPVLLPDLGVSFFQLDTRANHLLILSANLVVPI